MVPRSENGVRKALCASSDAAKGYKAWHRTLDRTLYMSDVDTIEWRFVGGRLVPVAVIELTTFSDDGIGEEKRSAVRDRFDRKTLQGQTTRAVARQLGVPALVFLHKADLSRFSVWDMEADSWFELAPSQIIDLLKGLPRLPWITMQQFASV